MLAHRAPHHFGQARSHSTGVVPGLAKREPGIYRAAETEEKWIPGSCCARPGMTSVDHVTISFNTAINACGAVTFGA